MKLSLVVASVLLMTGLVIFASLAYGYFLRRRYAARPGGVPPTVVVLPMFPVTLFAGVVMMLAGLQVWATAPLVGAAISIAGGIYLAAFLPYWRRIYRATASASASITEPVVLSMSPMTGLWLIGFAFAVILVWTVKL
jgi:Na+/glutamate symporter